MEHETIIPAHEMLQMSMLDQDLRTGRVTYRVFNVSNCMSRTVEDMMKDINAINSGHIRNVSIIGDGKHYVICEDQDA